MSLKMDSLVTFMRSVHTIARTWSRGIHFALQWRRSLIIYFWKVTCTLLSGWWKIACASQREFSSSRWRQFLQRDWLQSEREGRRINDLIAKGYARHSRSVFSAIIAAELIAPHHHHQGLSVFANILVNAARAFNIQRADSKSAEIWAA